MQLISTPSLTFDDVLLKDACDFMDSAKKDGKPFFLWHNNTRMHVWTRLSPEWENKSGYGLYADGMMELDWVVGQLLKKLDDLGIAQPERKEVLSFLDGLKADIVEARDVQAGQ